MLDIGILGKIDHFKRAPFGDVVIKGDFDNETYQIILMTPECLSDPSLMKLVARWRQENDRWFLSRFPATSERTTGWFQKNVIETQDRLLFLINIKDRYIGQVGLFRFDIEYMFAEIDNVLRGESGYPGMMQNAVLRLMAWGKDKLGLKFYRLKVLIDNARAIRLYERLGFKEIGRIPLTQVAGSDGLEWVEAPLENSNEAKRFYCVMQSLPI